MVLTTGSTLDFFVADAQSQWFEYRLEENTARLAAYSKLAQDGKAKMPFDNVAEFLRKAGYKAVVPGKHDFYFGPERLRQLERWLGERGVAMLRGEPSDSGRAA